MHNSDQITVKSLYLQHPKSLTLRWRPFSEWDGERVAVSLVYKDRQNIGYA